MLLMIFVFSLFQVSYYEKLDFHSYIRYFIRQKVSYFQKWLLNPNNIVNEFQVVSYYGQYELSRIFKEKLHGYSVLFMIHVIKVRVHLQDSTKQRLS